MGAEPHEHVDAPPGPPVYAPPGPSVASLPPTAAAPSAPHALDIPMTSQSGVERGSDFGTLSAPVTASFLGPALASLQSLGPWSQEPFPFAWFLTPLPEFVHPDSLVYLSGYEQPGGAAASSAPPTEATPEAAARRTTTLGSSLCALGLLGVIFPRIPTFLVMRLGGTGATIAGGLLACLSARHSIPDLIVGFNLMLLGLIMISFRGFAGFLLANIIAVWLMTKGLYRSCLCLSSIAATCIIISSFFSSSIIGLLLSYDLVLYGFRLVATGRRMAASEPRAVP